MSTSQDVLDEIVGIMAIEVRKIKEKSKDADTIDSKDSKALTDYCKSLTVAAKESRDQIKASGVEKLSDEELLEKAEEAMKALKGED